MPTNDELHQTDKRLEAAIDELRKQHEQGAKRLTQAEQHIQRLDEFMAELRESLATKDDIQGLRSDLQERFKRDDFTNERLGHYRQRIEDLEEERIQKLNVQESRKGRTLEWIVIGLVAIEAVVEVMMWMGSHHA